MNRKSIITGITTLIGFLVGLYVHNIFVYTIVGLAVGYLIVFWIPSIVAWKQRKNRHK
ncbi:hypothetical protein ACFQ4L_10600 [Lapidilactobacillus mulanensis]|uniref:DUF2273 domain-containing protein n=1 Tax=Lapidilactobacillus mulanensis TaxID=2485999 RepID=A0ABW4DTJ1_9LACO|nr:hypothetical protein [Lapidilactobacillus mulanensis]